MSSNGGHHPWGLAAVTATIILGIVAAFGKDYIQNWFQVLPPPPSPSWSAPTPSPPPKTAPPTTEPTTPRPEPSPSETYEPKAVLLTELDPTRTGSDIDTRESVELRGKKYSHAITYECVYFCNASIGVVEYNLGTHYAKFKTVIGVDDNASSGEQEGIFSVYLDGVLAGRRTATLGNPEEIELDVSGKVRLRLEATIGDIPGPLRQGVDAAGGKDNALPDLAWGDPTLYR